MHDMIVMVSHDSSCLDENPSGEGEFGIYELFISKIDIARADEGVTILEIENLEELKNKIIKVIIMVLIVSFFERILKISETFTDPIDMAYFALSILALSLGVYFIRKHS